MQNKTIYINALLDRYGSLLTKKQQHVCNLYYVEDLSLAEIAELESVSRTAIHDIIKRSEQLLLKYENKLKIYESFLKRMKLYKEIKSIGDKKVIELINKCIDTEI